MTYIAVRWIDASSTDPVLLYSELNPERWEVRKVEIYADGTAHFADTTQHSGITELGLLPAPPPEEISASPYFDLREVSPEEFETVWRSARCGGKISTS
jgi:hypothetical protein